MKIIELQAENVKRLKAVQIAPDGTVQVIGGRNAQGKSSVLDAIWLALGGGKASKETPLPIRDGEDRASVRLDLGDLIVTRAWTHKGTTLKVENAEGAAFSSPQTMLDALVGQLSFDPLAFTRLSPKAQREALLDLVDLDVDLDALDAEAKSVYQQRTDVGRQGKAIGDVTVDDSLPTEETSASDLISKIRDAQEAQRRIDQAAALVETTSQEVVALRKALKEAKLALERKEWDLAKAKEARQTLAAPPDVTLLETELATVEDTNAKIRANNPARQQKEKQDVLRNEYQSLTDRLTELDEQKATALAEATFPVEGLSFDESCVLYQGVPLSQASSAEQVRVSVAMGMALNPRLRVLMIKDGSLLDADSLAALREQVAEQDFQLWLEIVNPDDPTAVIIEDGQVTQA